MENKQGIAERREEELNNKINDMYKAFNCMGYFVNVGAGRFGCKSVYVYKNGTRLGKYNVPSKAVYVFGFRYMYKNHIHSTNTQLSRILKTLHKIKYVIDNPNA